MFDNSLTILILFISISYFSQSKTNEDRKSFNDGWKFAKVMQNGAEMPKFDDSE